MRIHPLALVCLLPAGAAAFAPQVSNTGSSTSLNANKKNVENIMAKPMIAAFAGMTLASQVAFAAMPPSQDTFAAPIVQERSATESSNMLLSAFGAPSSGFGGASFETLDFSMPSYDEGAKGKVAETKAAEAPPAFSNPFGDIKMPEIGGGDSSSDSASVASDDKAAARAAEKKADVERKAKEAEERRVSAEADKQASADRKAADKADKEAATQRRADERAAADRAKADDSAAADQAKADKAKAKSDESAAADQAKADKAARRAEQMQKQKEATARASKEEEAPKAAPAAVAVPEFKAPEVPDFKAPEMPEFKAPTMPKFSMPKIDVPDMPKIDTPKVDSAKFDMPKFEAPKFDSSKFSMPKVDTPKFDAPKFEAPKFSAPSMPAYDMPDTSSIKAPSLPAFSAPSFGGGASTVDPNLEPQEVRDERARDSRLVFLDADKEAKAIEAQAQAVRNIANDKKKVAAGFKDDACKTHWGGKIGCLRPLNSGY